MRIIGIALVAIVAVHAAPGFHGHTHLLHEHHATAGPRPVVMCSGHSTAIVIGVLWPETAIAPISPVIGHWHATLNAIGYQ